MKIPPPVVKIVVSVRGLAGVIYDRGSRVLADQWANPWGPRGLIHTRTHTLSMCVCVCVTCPSVVFISLLCIIRTESEWINTYAFDGRRAGVEGGALERGGRRVCAVGLSFVPIVKRKTVFPLRTAAGQRAYTYIYIHNIIHIVIYYYEYISV